MPAPTIFVYHPKKERILGNMSEGKEFAKEAIWDIEDVNAVATRLQGPVCHDFRVRHHGTSRSLKEAMLRHD